MNDFSINLAFGIFLILGIISFLAATFNASWFLNSENSKFFVKLFGTKGGRIFYIILGLILIIAGISGLIP